ncbi:MAG: hypothetical protein AB7S44_01855 [Spirochaetales bacterium]
MKYGITEKGNLIFCANCGKGLATDGEMKYNYCSRCGAPLSIESIEQKEDEILQIKTDLLDDLKDIAEKLETDSFEAVLTRYEDED